MGPLTLRPIGHMESDFSEKFGIPRQSGLVEALRARVVLEPEFRNPDALRGIEGFSHLWLIWEFSQARREGWSPTVRPPRLGGQRAHGGCSPPAPPSGPTPSACPASGWRGWSGTPRTAPPWRWRGADLLDGTPIFDIKPYVPYADCRPEALEGFAQRIAGPALAVDFPPDLLARVPEDKRAALTGVLAQDPRPRYQHDPERVYGLSFAGLEVKFRVAGTKLTVLSLEGPKV